MSSSKPFTLNAFVTSFGAALGVGLGGCGVLEGVGVGTFFLNKEMNLFNIFFMS